jgi:hypothetical protein
MADTDGSAAQDQNTDAPDADASKGDDDKGEKEFAPIQSQDELNRIVQARLARQREQFAGHDELKKKAAEYDKLQEASKTETQRLQDAATLATRNATDAEQRALRLEVAIEKGLTTAQAKRLVGTTKEELDADAEELLESFKPSDDGKRRPPSRQGSTTLRGGSDPEVETEETDPRKLAAMVHRRS